MTRSQFVAVGVSVLCVACSGSGSRNEYRVADTSPAASGVAPDTVRPTPPPTEQAVSKPAAARGSRTGARDSTIGRDSAIEWPKGGRPGRALPVAKRN
jgi:hypothetical protein